MPAKLKSLNAIAVASLKLIVGKKAVIPVLGLVNVVPVENGKILAVATNLDVWAFAPVENLKPGLHQIIGDNLYPVTGNVANFPEWRPHFDDAYKVQGMARATWNEIDRAGRCISKEESRYTLNGALCETRDNVTYLVSTDGHRLGVNALREGGNANGKRVLIARRAFEVANKLVAKASWVEFVFNQNEGDTNTTTSFSANGTRFIFRGLNGQFPNYEAVLTKNVKHQWQVNRLELLDALKKLAPFIKKEPTQSLRVERKKSTLALTVKSDMHTQTIEIPASFVDRYMVAQRSAVSIVMPLRLDNTAASSEHFGVNINFLREFAETMQSATVVLGLTNNREAITVAANYFTEDTPRKEVKAIEAAEAKLTAGKKAA